MTAVEDRRDASVSNAPLPLENRRDVLWIGEGFPVTLAGVCARRGLQLCRITRDRLSDAAPGARALVLEVTLDDLTFPQWGQQVVDEVLTHGLLVALVLHESEPGLPLFPDPAEALRFCEALSGLKRDTNRALGFYRDWERVADWVCERRPGPGANKHLRLEGQVPDEPATVTLLRRAFHDFSSVSLETLGGGKSGASVWMVTPGAEDRIRRPLPFVAKLQTLEKMRTERSNCLIVRDAVPARLHAALYADRCVEGCALGLVVYDLVSRAEPLGSVLPTAAKPARLIASLFEHTLVNCHALADPVIRPLVPEFEEQGLKTLRWSEELRRAAERAQERVPALTSVEVLRPHLDGLSPVAFRVGTVHGDLHVGNLFVPLRTEDVLLIDYGSLRTGAPIVADPACLEVSLTFPSRDIRGGQAAVTLPCLPDPAWLRAAYSYPLDASAVKIRSGGEAWIGHAVRAVRTAARQYERDPIPYAIAIASYLIRYASYDDHATLDDRALAYELACKLVYGVERELSRRGGGGSGRRRGGTG